MTLLQPHEGAPEIFGDCERNSPSDRSVEYFSTAANDVKFRIVRSRKLITNYRFSPARIDSQTLAK
jgi:hypothetical protein